MSPAWARRGGWAIYLYANCEVASDDTPGSRRMTPMVAVDDIAGRDGDTGVPASTVPGRCGTPVAVVGACDRSPEVSCVPPGASPGGHRPVRLVVTACVRASLGYNG